MNRRQIIFLLLTILTITIVLLVFKSNIISAEKLKSNKDVFSAIKDIAAIIGILFAVIFTYFKYFIGRTFSLNAETGIEITLIESPNNSYLHSLRISIKNIGSFAIWNPVITLSIIKHEGEAETTEVINDIQENMAVTGEKYDNVINPGETASIFFRKEIPGNIWAVNYKAQIVFGNRKTWYCSKYIKNKVETTNR